MVFVMMKRTKIAYSLMVMFIVALASTNLYFYFENNNLKSLLEQDRIKELSEKAADVWSRLGSFEGWYDYCMWELNRDLKENVSSEVKNLLVGRTETLLDRYSDRVYYDVKNDLKRLWWLDEEPSSRVYDNVSDTVTYALGQVDWATLGRGTNESVTLLWELYYMLGVDQITRAENLSGLRGIEFSFLRLYDYWDREYYFLLTNGRDKIPSYLAKPEVCLEWALGNATALYQNLTEWHERTKPSYP